MKDEKTSGKNGSKYVKIKQVDVETGLEIEGGLIALHQWRRHNEFSGGFYAMGQNALERIINNKKLKYSTVKVFSALVAELNYGNTILINQAELGKRIGMSRQHVNESIKVLIEQGIIAKGIKQGIRSLYMMNPEYVWKGSAKDHKKALEFYYTITKNVEKAAG